MELLYIAAAIYFVIIVPFRLWKADAIKEELQHRITELERYKEIYITEINNYKRKIDELYNNVDLAKKSERSYRDLFAIDNDKLYQIQELVEEHWKDDVKLYAEILDIINGEEDEA